MICKVVYKVLKREKGGEVSLFPGSSYFLNQLNSERMRPSLLGQRLQWEHTCSSLPSLRLQ